MPDHLPQDNGEKSLWGATAIADPVQQRLEESLKADVLVVGGGYTGLSSALHLAEQGVSVVLLEAKSIGFGGSGRNAGLVNAGVWQNPDHVITQLGEASGARFNLALRDSPELIFDLVRRFDISCDANRTGTVNIAHSQSGLTYLEDRCRQLQALGAPVEMIDGARAEAISASPVYCHGGILDPGAGTIHPLNYVRGLAKAALDQGALIFQESGIESLSRHSDRWLATTSQGKVSADQVIIATNAYADDNSQQVRKSTLPVFIFQCATEPLPADVAASIMPQRQGLWDTQTLMTSSRIDSSGRLVMSSAGRLQGLQRAIRQNWMRRSRDHLFPQTAGTAWEYQWSGQIGVTSSKILRVQLLAPGLFAPAGFNGRGIGPGTVIGKHLADTIVSGNRDDFPFPIEALYSEKWSALRAGSINYATLALQFLNKRWK
jgi:glycine/D-amino acid oxidase-like deaminating enzyme